MNLLENHRLVADPGRGLMERNTVAFANAARIDSAFHDQPLTEYLVGGWDRDPLTELREQLMPAVPASDLFNYKESDINDFFQTMPRAQLIRAMGGRFGMVDPGRRDKVSSELEEVGLVITVDKREVTGNPMAREQATDRIRRIILRSGILSMLAMIKAAAVNDGVTWDNTADPDMDVSDELLDVENTVGLRPTRVFYGSSAWSIRRRAYRGQDNAGARASAGSRESDVADFIGVNTISVTEARYRDAINSLATMIGNQVLMYHAEQGLGIDDPSNVKRFVGTIDGSAQMVFVEEFARHWEITVAEKDLPALTSSLGMRRFTVAAS